MSNDHSPESTPPAAPALNINTVLSLPLVKVGSIAIALLTAGWFSKGYVAELTGAISDLRVEVATLRIELKTELERRTFDRWTRTDQQVWAYELERLNTAQKLVIPPRVFTSANE